MNDSSIPMSDTAFYPPPESAQKSARISGMESYAKLCKEAELDYEGYWMRRAQSLLHWHKPFTQGLDDSTPPFYRWFADGQLNASYNCLDRHVNAGLGDKTAIIFEADNAEITKVSYNDLLAQVCRLANGMRSLGVQKGDRVAIYLPMSVEGIVAMLACARIGAIHSVIFGGFSAHALHDRVKDTQARLMITADGQHRGGKTLPLKTIADEALSKTFHNTVRHVIVLSYAGIEVNMYPGRDLWYHDLVDKQSDMCEPEWVGAEHPLFLLYTSGSTGTPKGVQHATGGYMLQATLSMHYSFDIKPTSDIFWCTADIGWITGHTYMAYGPLSCGVTQVIFGGIPTYPDASRFWRIIDQHKVNIFYTAPTAIRSLIKAAENEPQHHPRHFDLSSLRILGSVGEPINPTAWEWYHKEVGGGRCPVVDTFWQTETGAHVITPMPGATPLVPGSCTLPFPGIQAAVVDETGQELPHGEAGILVIKRPWPSMIRTIWRTPARFINGYYPDEFDGQLYLAGDGAVRDKKTGYFTITGRIDDTLNVSGHRMGTMEIESSLVAHEQVSEAAVVGKPDDLTGESILAFVVLSTERPDAAEEVKSLTKELQDWVSHDISPIARPKEIRFCDSLPKTRSGKIMRRLLRQIARDEPITQDISTLENPSVLEQLRKSTAGS